ncbi:MAG: GNAT family N-acetyltransferase [Candidatus Heimdallarchaeota archaeon]
MFIGKKVILRSLELSDLDYIVKHDNNLDLRHNLGTAVPCSRQDSENWIRESWEKRKIGERFVFAFTNKETSEFIGVVNLYIINKTSKSAALGIWIYEEKNKSKGYGTDAMELILDFGFNYINLNRIELSVYPHNLRAIKLYEKIGFVKVANLRQSRYMNGKYIDEIIMDILRDDWVQTK